MRATHFRRWSECPLIPHRVSRPADSVVLLLIPGSRRTPHPLAARLSDAARALLLRHSVRADSTVLVAADFAISIIGDSAVLVSAVSALVRVLAAGLADGVAGVGAGIGD